MSSRFSIAWLICTIGAACTLSYSSVWGAEISTPEFYSDMIPADNPLSPAKVRLGEKLFNETRMSANGKVSCQTCHLPERAFTDGKRVSEGVGKTQRNAPPVMDAHFNAMQFWDGRAPSLEEQAKLPILNPVEMGLKDGQEAVDKIAAIPEYRKLFAEAFDGSTETTFEKIVMAIASFERTKISRTSPFERYLAGNEKAISAAAKRGWSLFNGEGRCISCHGFNPTAPFFTDYRFHNIGIAAHRKNFTELAVRGLAVVERGNTKQIDELAIQDPDFTELGRFLVTKNPGDVGAFKTPSLRNIAVTGPYMHDGSLVTLWDVMDHYNKGGVANPFLDGGIHRLGLSERQIDELVEFMFTLTSPEFDKLARSEQGRQRALSRTKRPERDVALAMGRKGSASDAVIPQNVKDAALVGGRTIEKRQD